MSVIHDLMMRTFCRDKGFILVSFLSTFCIVFIEGGLYFGNLFFFFFYTEVIANLQRSPFVSDSILSSGVEDLKCCRVLIGCQSTMILECVLSHRGCGCFQ